MKHRIDTGNAKPIKIPPRRLPYAQREIVGKEISKMLDNDVIEPNDSPWSALLLLVAKKDGSWRFCIDNLTQVLRKTLIRFSLGTHLIFRPLRGPPKLPC